MLFIVMPLFLSHESYERPCLPSPLPCIVCGRMAGRHQRQAGLLGPECVQRHGTRWLGPGEKGESTGAGWRGGEWGARQGSHGLLGGAKGGSRGGSNVGQWVGRGKGSNRGYRSHLLPTTRACLTPYPRPLVTPSPSVNSLRDSNFPACPDPALHMRSCTFHAPADCTCPAPIDGTCPTTMNYPFEGDL